VANLVTADLMVLPSNLQCALDGSPLPFFSPYPVPGSSGVNLFDKRPYNHGHFFSNSYVLPPIILIPQVSRFVKSESFPCTIGVPDIRPQKFLWPLLQSYSSLQLAPRGTLGMVLPISSEGFSPRWPLSWDFWVFRIVPLSDIHE